MNENIILTEADIIHACELKKQIDEMTKELNAILDKARLQANGESANFFAGENCLTVKKPGKASEKLDEAAWKANAPKDHARVFALYHKTTSPRAAAVTVCYK